MTVAVIVGLVAVLLAAAGGWVLWSGRQPGWWPSWWPGTDVVDVAAPTVPGTDPDEQTEPVRVPLRERLRPPSSRTAELEAALDEPSVRDGHPDEVEIVGPPDGAPTVERLEWLTRHVAEMRAAAADGRPPQRGQQTAGRELIRLAGELTHPNGQQDGDLNRQRRELTRLRRELTELVAAHPGDTRPTLPAPWPAAFASHIPPFVLPTTAGEGRSGWARRGLPEPLPPASS